MLLRFALAFLLFTFGPGAICGLWLTRTLDTPRRIVVLLGIGGAASAVLIDVLGRLGLLAAFPYVVLAMSAIAFARWRSGGTRKITDGGAWTGRDLAACLLILALAVGTGYIAFAHRLSSKPDGIELRGDYDSVDLSYYAAISAEATHTVPPDAPYYAGRELNYAYYPQLVPAMVHRFAGVPMLDIYFKYAWPMFLSLAGLSAYLTVRALASCATALLAVVLLMLAGDFSYLAAWFLPHAGFNWDYVLWPTNFLSPTMESLFFNSWTPSLPILFTALWGIAHALKTRAHAWTWMSALLLGVTFQFKPFAFIVVAAALAASFVMAGADSRARRHFAALLLLSGVVALPFIYRAARLYADRRSELRFDLFLLPQRMLIKLDLMDAFTAWSGRTSPTPWMARPLLVLAATGLFFAGGMGVRWLGVPALLHALRGRMTEDAAMWRLVAWIAVAGIAIPFVLVTEPYNDTLQFYQTGLYVLWIFTAAALVRIWRRHRAAGAVLIAVLIAISLPSSLHYLQRRWTDDQRPPLAGLTRSEVDMATYLRTRDPESTVIINDRPLDPSLLAVLSERRVVLAWGRYAVGSGERLREVDAFYGSSRDLPNLLEILRKHHVTHVVVHTDRDKVRAEVLAKLRFVMGDERVRLYEVPWQVQKN